MENNNVYLEPEIAPAYQVPAFQSPAVQGNDQYYDQYNPFAQFNPAAAQQLDPNTQFDINKLDEQAEQQYAEKLSMLLPSRRYANPFLVLALLLICFPVGIVVMLCFTKWGAYPKIIITLFVLSVAVAVYEILVARNVLLLPSLFGTLEGLFR